MKDGTRFPETPVSTSAPRRVRADAERNRQALLAAARAALAADSGALSLEAVARQAGVGIGTLYRHFPTRAQLLTAAYEAQVEDLIAQAGALLEQLPPQQALREWLDEFVRFVMTKRGVLDALRTEAVDSPGRHDVTGMRERIALAIAPILRAGGRDGSLRADAQAEDVVLLVAGSLMSVEVDAAQTQRLLGLILDALRPD